MTPTRMMEMMKSKAASAPQPPACKYPDGTLVKIAHTKAIFVIVDCARRAVPNMDVFDHHKFEQARMKIIDVADFENLKVGPVLTREPYMKNH